MRSVVVKVSTVSPEDSFLKWYTYKWGWILSLFSHWRNDSFFVLKSIYLVLCRYPTFWYFSSFSTPPYTLLCLSRIVSISPSYNTRSVTQIIQDLWHDTTQDLRVTTTSVLRTGPLIFFMFFMFFFRRQII